MTNPAPVALITGAARRIGAAIARALHSEGYRVILHCRASTAAAQALAQALNETRPDSARVLSADLNQVGDLTAMAESALKVWGRIDALINNASSFYPTPIGTGSEQHWDDLVGSNMKAPFFLAQALAPALRETEGSIINIADIYAERPLANHTIYCMAKAGNVMLTKSLAQELAPQVRVNSVAPGAIIWPEQKSDFSESQKQTILERIPLHRQGEAEDIARTVVFLVAQAPYVTGQIIAVDGGRSLSI